MGLDDLAETLKRAYPELEPARSIPVPVYLVGGSVRDLLLGRERSDIDLAVVGNPFTVTEHLGGTLGASGFRNGFGTAEIELGGHRIDVAMTRSEFYPHPGALPVVEAITNIEADLVRRDFTVNAMAIPLNDEVRLIDPHGGLGDLESGLLRILHPESFIDDPTRAIRAARYAARLGFALEAKTEELLRATDLGSVSEDRRRRELTHLAWEDTLLEGLALLGSWNLVDLPEDRIVLARRVFELLETKRWGSKAARSRVLLAAAFEPIEEAERVAAAAPQRPSEAVELATGRDVNQLLLARALGAEWLDPYMDEWRSVSLEVDGTDLLAAGIPGGPAIGRGLKAALRRKLDGEISGREEEMAAALEAARDE